MECARLFDLIAHDLRSPVAVISGYARMLSEGRIRPEEYVDAYLRIERAAARVSAVGERAAEVSRWLGRTTVPDPQALTVEACLARGLARAESRDRATIEIPTEPVLLSVDREAVGGALGLVIDAVAHEVTRGPISIHARLAAEASACDILVGPAGAAIDVEAPPVPDGAAAPVPVFPHLGYYVAAAVVEAHGGRVWLADGRADAFGIRLPISGS